MLPRTSFEVYKVFSRNVIKNSVEKLLYSSRSLANFTNVTVTDGKKFQEPTACLKLNSAIPLTLYDNTERWRKISPPINGRILELPRPNLTSLVLDLPPTRTVIPFNPTPEVPALEAPSSSRHEEKQAARLIVIRRRMMKKHKLKKLRKKMKFEWAKVRQKRELRKEKAFQAMLMSQIREAEKFDAEAYVTEKIRQAKEKPLPRTWKGRRLPEFLIKQYMGIK